MPGSQNKSPLNTPRAPEQSCDMQPTSKRPRLVASSDVNLPWPADFLPPLFLASVTDIVTDVGPGNLIQPRGTPRICLSPWELFSVCPPCVGVWWGEA